MTRTWFTVCDTLGWIPHYSGRLPPWSLVCVCRSEFDKLEDELTAPFEPEGGGTYDPPTHRREAGPPYYHTPSNIDFCCCFFLFVVVFSFLLGSEQAPSIDTNTKHSFQFVIVRKAWVETVLAIRSGRSVKAVVAFPTVARNVERPVASLLCHRAVTSCLHKHDQ